ncbi:hypothetical protein [Microbacterium sp. GCS4]|uniref:hypothetical protein n=1 Tax=Microbacterium sp. GCS4 TaxID=1692239 RepID=UPI00068131C4|nr:hypothetical protein [Microbacterium sp. GCS4]KNY04663.1 hypothetical protein AKH00_14215 [Microbacterium sp. GCS4]
MSYDIDVFGTMALTSRELAKLVASLPELKPRRHWPSGQLTSVVNADTGDTCLTIDGPLRVGPEDLVEGIEIVDATVMYSVHAVRTSSELEVREGTVAEPANIAYAIRFANRLAEAINGKAVDLQRHESASSDRVSETLRQSNEENRWVHMLWYRLPGESSASKNFAATYLAVARRVLPSAVPMRFGTHEPWQGRFPRDDDARFAAIYGEDCRASDLKLESANFEMGLISAWGSVRGRKLQTAHIVFSLSKLEQNGDVAKVRYFVEEFARESGCFFASAEVSDDLFDPTYPVIFDGGWGGVPATPLWITWYNAEYADVVRPFVRGGNLHEQKGNLLHDWSEEPVDAIDIATIAGETVRIPYEITGIADEGRSPVSPAPLLPALLRKADF